MKSTAASSKKPTGNGSDGQFPLRLERRGFSVRIYFHRDHAGYEVYTLVYYLNGKRHRPTFASLENAKAEADVVLDKFRSGETDLLTLKVSERLVYLRAKEIAEKIAVPLDVLASEYAYAQGLLGQQGTIQETVRFWLKSRPTALQAATVEQVVTELLAARQADGSCERHIRDLRARLTAFAAAFRCQIQDVSAGDISGYLLAVKGQPRTKNNHRKAISNLFSFARLNGYVAKDCKPLDEVPWAKEPVKDVQIFGVDELQKLLPHVPTKFSAYLLIAAFAGLRRSEIERLDWKDVGPRYIRVRPAGQRTKSTRLVEILPNLQKWLARFRQPEGKVVPVASVGNQISRLAKKAGVKWRQNALRHSYGSYRLAVIQDVPRLAYEMGNTPRIVFRHYRELVTPEDGQAWFSVMPDSYTDTVPVMPDGKPR